MKSDGDDRNTRARVHLGDAPEEKTVLGHGEIDAGRGQHSLAEETERGNCDSNCDEGCPFSSEREAHHIGRGGLRSGQSGGTERIRTNEGN